MVAGTEITGPLRLSRGSSVTPSRRLRSSKIENSYLTRECRDKRGIFILSYMVNLSSIKHFIIPHKSKTKHPLNIDDLYTEVIAVTESIKECKFPLVPSVEESDSSVEEETKPEPEVYPMTTIKHEGQEVGKVRCGTCEACLTPDCRSCKYCLDMKKYGGPGIKRQPCKLRPKCHERGQKERSNA